MARRIPALSLALVAIVGLSADALARDAASLDHGGAADVSIAVEAPGVVQPRGSDLAACLPTASTAPPAAYQRPDGSRQGEATAARRPRPVAVFLGDSYTSGWRGVGEGAAGWPAILGAVRGWTVNDLAVAGTGFVYPGSTGQPIRTQVGAAVRLRPGIVFLAGGHNDEDQATGPVTAAADAVLERLSRALPDAVIVVIGPIWPDANPKAALVRLRDHLRARAAELGALFIDPIGDRWFAGANERFIGPDGTHPTSFGYRRIARLVGAALETDPRLSVSLARDKVTQSGAATGSPAWTPWTPGPPGLIPCAS